MDLKRESARQTTPEEGSWRGETEAVGLEAEQERTECRPVTGRRGAGSRQAVVVVEDGKLVDLPGLRRGAEPCAGVSVTGNTGGELAR